MKANVDRPDPPIDEIRAIRQKISDRFGGDIKKLSEHYREMQSREPYASRLIKIKPSSKKRLPKKAVRKTAD